VQKLLEYRVSNLAMASLLLDSNSVLMCQHGGIVMHTPSVMTAYRVAGRLPMLLGDVYSIVGCPFRIGGAPSPCIRVEWITSSTLLIIKGRPALTNTSIGLCVSPSGAPQGPVIIAQIQLGQFEPDSPTSIND
jgi:hypothetical protein